MGNPYYEPTIMVHDMHIIQATCMHIMYNLLTYMLFGIVNHCALCEDLYYIIIWTSMLPYCSIIIGPTTSSIFLANIVICLKVIRRTAQVLNHIPALEHNQLNSPSSNLLAY